VFGFDVLLDTQLRAWLLEVNTCPALNADSPLDMGVKTNMVSDSCSKVDLLYGCPLLLETRVVG
jgi:D-alanine-D-alanine ligase-like ATP-grasp enzyme